MMKKNKIRVLVVDDSIVFREVIVRGLSEYEEIEVVAKARDPYEARDLLLEFDPDVMTCDVEMPRMNGIEFIRRLLPQYHIPVIVVSGVTEAVFDAMDVGAVDFVAKPLNKTPAGIREFIEELSIKIKIAAKSKVTICEDTKVQKNCSSGRFDKEKIVAIGASTGGTEAIYNVLKQLPDNMVGIVVVQHIPAEFSRMFAERLDKQIDLNVKEAKTGDWIEPGQVLIAPGDYHMRVKRVGDRHQVVLFESEKVNGHCPSVDILFDSVAKEVGKKAVGIILTGMGYDGAKGLLAMRRKGARTIGQDEKSCVVYGMPKVAYDIGAVEVQTALSTIPQTLCNMLK